MDMETKRMIILSKNKRSILKTLYNEPKMMIELKKETNLLIQNLSRNIKELKELGFVEQINPEVRKGKMFNLTEKGKKELNELIKKGLL